MCVKIYKLNNDISKGKYLRQFNRYGNISRKDNNQSTTINSSFISNSSSRVNTSSSNEASNLYAQKWKRREYNYNSNRIRLKKIILKKLKNLKLDMGLGAI